MSGDLNIKIPLTSHRKKGADKYHYCPLNLHPFFNKGFMGGSFLFWKEAQQK